jgi:GNAT superfamily N-acetyltransferase
MTLEKLSADPEGHFFDTLEQATVFGAFLAEELVGMAGLSHEPGTREAHKGMLWGLYVRPGNRRTGLGRALLRAALAHARASSSKSCSMSSATTNRPAGCMKARASRPTA